MATSARKILQVFLASPSDLQNERRLSRDAVDMLNGVLRGIGWTVAPGLSLEIQRWTGRAYGGDVYEGLHCE